MPTTDAASHAHDIHVVDHLHWHVPLMALPAGLITRRMVRVRIFCDADT
ncbi:hypothetical protein KQI52_03000 [bacterium]|nr:hypothetical protein [bacterium]